MRVEDIVNKVFTRSFMGYDIEQVDLFLDEVIERFEQYESERKEMLIAMEYLLDKLENGQKLPIAEMKKAINSGKPEKKRSAQGERKTEGCDPKSAKKKRVSQEAAQVNQTEKKQTARSIARGTQPPKPVRAPKVARVIAPPQQTSAKQQKEDTVRTVPDVRQNKTQNKGTLTEQQVEKYEEEAPVMENWLDELLVNLVEREKTGYGVPLDSAEAPNCNNGDVETKNGHAEQNAPEEAGDGEEAEGEEFPEESDRGE